PFLRQARGYPHSPIPRQGRHLMSRKVLKGHASKPSKWRDRWRAYIVMGHNPDGTMIRRWIYGKTRKECQEKTDLLRDKLRAGYNVAEDSTLREFLQVWLNHKEGVVEPSSLVT